MLCYKFFARCKSHNSAENPHVVGTNVNTLMHIGTQAQKGTKLHHYIRNEMKRRHENKKRKERNQTYTTLIVAVAVIVDVAHFDSRIRDAHA